MTLARSTQFLRRVTAVAALWVCLLCGHQNCPTRAVAATADPQTPHRHCVPILYSTDLFHPHDDPDDHYDLATLFALEEFDLKGIILDLGATQKERIGEPPIRQMEAITRREVAYAIGLSQPLRSADDKKRDEPKEFQGGVELILSVLKESPEKVVVFTTGSVRDVVAAFNREPALLRDRVSAVYFNAGRGPDGNQDECNVNYDPVAYGRLFESGLPLSWCPCFGGNGYATFFKADQETVVGACVERVRNYFTFCLTKPDADPLQFLDSGPHPLPTGGRSMWCTAPLFHAAGRSVYELPNGEFAALPPATVTPLPPGAMPAPAFQFIPAVVRMAEAETQPAQPSKTPKPGEVAATYLGQTADRVGTSSPAPDGRKDCCVRVLGVPADKPIANLVLTAPREGRWERDETGRWWRLACNRQSGGLDCYFSFWAAGEHSLKIRYAREGDGSTQTVTFSVPDQSVVPLTTAIGATNPNVRIFRAPHPGYGEIMASCLKNVLLGLGR
ncbi:MAG: hypothetical protein COY42_15295 [Armatimonadetes bacterium CG_4_10_14_0_8_um_filter_66_14]|nr:MAG: hypothetical protein COY42_15295 [Armatimonadetes bacterium CG_4_10_14_0_8_um_filter_66_14]